MKFEADKIRNIAVFRALQLGDMLCSVPAFRALRTAYPEAHITLICLPWAVSFVERFYKYFDELIIFPGYPGLPEQKFIPKDFTVFLAEVQHREYDLVLQMQGNGSIVNYMIELLGAKHSAGFCLKNDFKPNDNFLEYPEGISEIDKHLLLMEHLGIPSAGRELEFPVTEKDEQDFRAAGFDIEPGKYVCVHPGSRSAARQWPPEHFASLARYCHEQGFKIVLTGTKDELDIVQQVINHLDFEVVNAAGKTSLGGIAILIKNAFALIANCTGVSHIASATKTPSVILSQDGEPERWGPIDRNLHRTIDWLKNPDFDVVFSELVSLMNEKMLVKSQEV